MNTKKILVTGAAGFIGYHFAKHCRLTKNFVVGLDNFNHYYLPELKRAREQELLKQEIEIVEGDIQDQALIEKLFQEHQITHVVHLAAQAGVRYSLANPNAYIDSNVKGFLSILEALRKFPHIKLVFASSSSVYGLNTKTPFSIQDRTDAQASLYGATKKSNELFAHTYHHLFGITTIGLRFFTVYGPWGRPDMAYWTFTENILNNQPISLYNYGEMERDFTYIDDIIDGMEDALNQEGFQLYNLGNHHPVSLNRFVDIIEKACKKKAIKVPKKMQPGDVKKTYADISTARNDLNFHPKVSIEEGIASFVNWFKENSFSKFPENPSIETNKQTIL